MSPFPLTNSHRHITYGACSACPHPRCTHFAQTLAVFSPSCIDHVFVLSNELDIAECVPELVASWVPSGSLCVCSVALTFATETAARFGLYEVISPRNNICQSMFSVLSRGV